VEHPFINNISDKSLEELQTQISDLQKKLGFAYRTGNGPLISQINMAINSYQAACGKKMDDMIKKQNMGATINIQKQ